MSFPHAPVAIVTGAGGGVGAAVVRRLAARQLAVAAVDLRESWCAGTLDALAEHRARARAFGADLRFLHEAEATVLRVVEVLGPPSVVVNIPQDVPAAGVGRLRDEEQDWDAVIRTRLRAPLLLSRAAQQHLADSGQGRIVNVASRQGARPHHVTELVAQAGLDVITRMLAEELKSFGAAVVTVDSEGGEPGVAPRTEVPPRAGAGPRAVEGGAEELACAVEYLVCDADPEVSGRRVAVADCLSR